MIEIVSPALVDRVWPELQEGMRTACEKGGNQFSEGGLHLICRRGDAYLCLMRGDDPDRVQCALICQEEQWATRQVLNVIAVTGGDRMDWWRPMVDWSKGMFPGCGSIVFEGRPGWGSMPKVRVLRHVYEMDL